MPIGPIGPVGLAGLVVGVGACRDTPVDEVAELVADALRDAGLRAADVVAFATVDVKADEAGIVGAAARFGVPVLSYGAEALARVAVPHPSARAAAVIGTPSVAEAAALVGGGSLLVPKRKSAPRGRPPQATCAVAGVAAGDWGDPSPGMGVRATLNDRSDRVIQPSDDIDHPRDDRE